MKKSTNKIICYFGYFLLDSGLKIEFDIPEDEANDIYRKMINAEFECDSTTVYLGEYAICPFILTKKIIGFQIDTYEKEGE